MKLLHVCTYLLVLAAFYTTTCYGDNIVEIAVGSAPEFTTLVTAVVTAGLAEALSGGDLTVFAPTNEAFAKLGNIVDFLLIDDDYTANLLTQVLTYHVLGESLATSDFSTAVSSQVTLNGEPLTVDLPALKVNDANIVATNITADNGVIHVIDSVLIPSGFPSSTIAEIAVDNEFTILVAALNVTGLLPLFVEPQGKVYTVFAPTDQAFADFLAKFPGATLEMITTDPVLKFLLKLTLLKHVIPGDAVDAATLSGFSVRKKIRTASGFRFKKNTFLNKVVPGLTDVAALQGYVHVIDEVISTRACTNAFKRRVRRLNQRAARAARRSRRRRGRKL